VFKIKVEKSSFYLSSLLPFFAKRSA